LPEKESIFSVQKPFVSGWSLWDMISQSGWRLCTMYGEIVRLSGMLLGASIGTGKSLGQKQHTEKAKELFTEAGSEILATCLELEIVDELKKLGLEVSTTLTMNLVLDLKSKLFDFVDPRCYDRLDSIRHSIQVELGERRFAYIPPSNDKYFEQEKLFGDEVYEKFKRARQDIKDAGNCLAASLPTAGVFHLMRVAEHGLRSLAQKLRVRLTHTRKNCPIEFADWNKIVEACENRIEEARKLPAGPKRQAKLELYSDAADHCTFMKDIWRNTMAHTRKSYKESEAIGVLERVRDFTVFLGRNL
jgi:hypothetical protein